MIRSGLPPSVPTGSSHRSERNPRAPAYFVFWAGPSEAGLGSGLYAIHPSAWKKNSANFVSKVFSEVRCAGVPGNIKILLPFLTEAL